MRFHVSARFRPRADRQGTDPRSRIAGPRTGFAVVVVCGVAGVLAAQTAARVKITSPPSGAYLAGPIRVEIAIEPSARAADAKQVSFYVDGRETCVVDAPPFACDWEAPREVVAHTIRVVVSFSDGQRLTDTIHTRGLGYTEKVAVDAIQLSVVVTDGQGRFVQHLPRSAFRVFENDQPQTLTTFASDDIPLELVAALDVSQSMTDAIPDLKVAARMFLTSLGERSQVTLLAFNDNIFTLARKTTANDAKLRAVQRLEPWGGTALYDVVIRGMDMLGRQTGRRALVVFSDGEDQSSRATLQAATHRIEASDATIYAVGLGRATSRGPLHDLLDRFATIGGGRGLFTENSADLGRMFGEVFEDLSHQYLVGYQPGNQKRDGAWRKLRVEVSGGPYKVRHRQGYRLVEP